MCGSAHTTVGAVLNPPSGGRGGYARLIIALLSSQHLNARAHPGQTRRCIDRITATQQLIDAVDRYRRARLLCVVYVSKY
jgi:hypothetical protein